MFNEGLLIGKPPFQDWAMPEKNCSIHGTMLRSPKTHYSPAEIEDLAVSKIKFFIILLSSLKRLSSYYMRLTALLRKKLLNSWVFLKQGGWPCYA